MSTSSRTGKERANGPPTPEPQRSAVSLRNCVVVLLLCCTALLQTRLPTMRMTRNTVSWDSHSLLLNGQRTFIFAGEFHPWRLPVPHLWRDILQKMKAAGLNTVSTYIHWGMVNPAEGVFDWNGPRSIRSFLQMAKEEGLYVIARPGPYIQAETTAGGLPGWVTLLDTPLRTDTALWHQAWSPYIDSFIEQIQSYTYDRGGPIIAFQLENEHEQRSDTEGYLEDLRKHFRQTGITVPLTINDADPELELDKTFYKGNFAQGRGSQDLFGIDMYPFGFECSEDVWNATLPHRLEELSHRLHPSSPPFVPEWQSGAFLGWGSKYDYDKCRHTFGAESAQVFGLKMLAQNVKLINHYMFYGGTNWGHLACPQVYTSYDYGSAIAESRLLTPKYYEIKSQGLFLKSAPIFASTMMEHTVPASTKDIVIKPLRAADGSKFYFVCHRNVSSSQALEFTFEMSTSMGRVRIPDQSQLTLHGQRAAILVSDFRFSRSKIVYSTAPLVWAGVIGKHDVVVFTNALGPLLHLEVERPGNTHRSITIQSQYTLDIVAVSEPSLHVLLLHTDLAKFVWAPEIEGASILVIGPYLVRKARIIDKVHLLLYGDVDGDTLVDVIVPESISRISWNGVPTELAHVARVQGGLSFTVSGPPINLQLPKLVRWRYADGLPEREPDFDDSLWQIADKLETTTPFSPSAGEKILFACDYGFCTGSVLYRALFRSNDSSGLIALDVQGGHGMAASVWMNGVQVATYMDSGSRQSLQKSQRLEFVIPSAVSGLTAHSITVVVDNMGQEFEDDRDTKRVQTPRGIVGYHATSGQFEMWRIQGFEGGCTGFRDRLRGVYNEGGTYGERQGWHRSDTDDSHWPVRSPSEGLSEAGIGVFRATFVLDLPRDLDIPLQLNLPADKGSYRVDIYVNGWKIGKRVANLGPQTVFPVPDGILHHRGENTLTLFVWALDGPLQLDGIFFEAAGVLKGGVA